ncbi:Pilus assembly protein PilO [Candidatus Thiomargarita nelsonii]|uniref:Pilus assembly protein PilO n=1 Tax=Candidatus Thiomargarita nelsonii TaxID=1003181 RepID=A0A0A6NZS8_9GAMM|nr:Pilus assembly protein PilO [Candidatus Thiomargarita nelsonii]
MTIEDFSHLDPVNFGNWPVPIKGLIILVLCIAALFAGYWFDTQNQMVELAKVKQEEETFKKTFKTKQLKAASLPKLEEQLVEIEFILKELFKKLPSDAQVDELIKKISQTVLASGLKQELFEPQYKGQREEKGLYVNLPVKLRATGDYHAFGKFVSGVAAMNRIVTQHEVSISSSSKRGTEKLLTIEITAQIYRYLEEPTKKEGKKGNKKKKRKK